MSRPEYEVRLDRRVRVPMRDGVELAAVVVRPRAEGRFPAIMSYNPYRWLRQVKDTSSDTTYNHRWDGPPYFAQRGYAVVYFDVRGTGNSGGNTQDIYSDEERLDACDMVEWIAAQPWCSGNVGMWGMSYGGVVQWQVGVQNPPALKTLVIGSSNTDVYLDWTNPGGSIRPYMFDSFAPMMTAFNMSPPDADIVGPAGPNYGKSAWNRTFLGESVSSRICSRDPTGAIARCNPTTAGSRSPSCSGAAGPILIPLPS